MQVMRGCATSTQDVLWAAACLRSYSLLRSSMITRFCFIINRTAVHYRLRVMLMNAVGLPGGLWGEARECTPECHRVSALLIFSCVTLICLHSTAFAAFCMPRLGAPVDWSGDASFVLRVTSRHDPASNTCPGHSTVPIFQPKSVLPCLLLDSMNSPCRKAISWAVS
jgi:hypothetical protein